MRAFLISLMTLAALAPAASAATLPPETVEARERFFGAENVDPAGNVRKDKAIASWFGVSNLAFAIKGHVVLLDSYIHKPGYVPTTVDELVALKPEAIFLGHGHGDHANNTGEIAKRTGALVVGTPEHCDTAAAQAGQPVKCSPTVSRGSLPGAELNDIRPLGQDVCVSAMKHVHSAAEPPDEHHRGNTDLILTPIPDPTLLLLHPPGPAAVTGLATAGGDEGSSVLYQFRVGKFALVWNDTSGPLRERAPGVFDVMGRLPQTDIEIGAVLGFNNPTNGMRDPVDYLEALEPTVFYPVHHDFITEYGSSNDFEPVMKREIATRRGIDTELRWLNDPYDYLRPGVMTFDLDAPRWTRDGANCAQPAPKTAKPKAKRKKKRARRA